MRADTKSKITCYSEDEGTFMRRSQEIRSRVLGSLLSLLAGLRFTPNQLTLLSLLAGLAFCPVLLWSSFVVYAWMPVGAYLWRGSMDYLLRILTVLLAVKALTRFIRIRRRI